MISLSPRIHAALAISATILLLAPPLSWAIRIMTDIGHSLDALSEAQARISPLEARRMDAHTSFHGLDERASNAVGPLDVFLAEDVARADLISTIDQIVISAGQGQDNLPQIYPIESGGAELSSTVTISGEPREVLSAFDVAAMPGIYIANAELTTSIGSTGRTEGNLRLTLVRYALREGEDAQQQ